MGGIIAMAPAFPRPELIDAAVLNDVGLRVAAKGLARITGYVCGTAMAGDERSDILDQARVNEMRLLATDVAYAAVPDVDHTPTLSEPHPRQAIRRPLDEAG